MKAFILFFGFSLCVYAGDAANFKFLGFSKDGQYYAFLQSGISDGSGFPYASGSVIRVKDSAVVRSRSLSLDEDFSVEETAVTLLIEKLNLVSFGIDGKNPGRELLHRLASDYSEYLNTVFTIGESPEGGIAFTNSKYSVVVEETEAGRLKTNDYCHEQHRNSKIKVSIEGKTGTRGESFVLLNERRQPRQRYCSGYFKVTNIFTHNESKALVVILNYQQPGFEGPNYRFQVVSGTPDLRAYP